MCNEGEADLWRVDITLMYAEHVPFLIPPTPHSVTPSQEQSPQPAEKTLKELLGEQKTGERG